MRMYLILLKSKKQWASVTLFPSTQNTKKHHGIKRNNLKKKGDASLWITRQDLFFLIDSCIPFFKFTSSPSLTACSYLLLLCLLQVPPLLQGLAEVHTAHRYLHRSYGIVFWETVKVVHSHHQCLPAQFSVRYLQCKTHIKDSNFKKHVMIIVNTVRINMEFYLKCESLIEVGFECLPMNFGFKLFLFVREQIKFNVRVRATSYIHGRKLCSLQDAHHQL